MVAVVAVAVTAAAMAAGWRWRSVRSALSGAAGASLFRPLQWWALEAPRRCSVAVAPLPCSRTWVVRVVLLPSNASSHLDSSNVTDLGCSRFAM